MQFHNRCANFLLSKTSLAITKSCKWKILVTRNQLLLLLISFHFKIKIVNDGLSKSNDMSNGMICQMTSQGPNQKKPSLQDHSDPSIPLVWFLPPPRSHLIVVQPYINRGRGRIQTKFSDSWRVCFWICCCVAVCPLPLQWHNSRITMMEKIGSKKVLHIGEHLRQNS